MSLNKKYSKSILAVLITTVAFAGIYLYIFDKKLDLNGDNANYFMLGKALASGEGYVSINNIHKTPNNHFPPGYPALISAVVSIAGDSIITIKLFNGLLFLATAIALYFLIKKITQKNSTALLVIFLLLLNSHLLRYSTMIMTEIPFLFFSTLAVLSFTMIDFEKPFWRDKWIYIALALLIISFYIRTTGIALIGGIILYLLIQKKWKHAIFIAIAIVILALPWQIRSQKLGGSSYMKQLVMVNPYRPEMGTAGFSDYLNRFGTNVSRYITKEIPSATFSFFKPDYRQPSTASQWFTGILILLLIIYGVWNLPQFKWLILAYLVGTFGILSLWPDVWVGVRFLLPAVPFLLLGIIKGIQNVIEKIIPGKSVQYLLWLPVLLTLPFLPKLKPLHEQAQNKLTANWANYFTLAKWINDNEDHNVVVSCRKPTMFHLYSNSFTTNYIYTNNNQELIDNLIERQVDYVILDQLGYSSTYRYLLPAVQNNQDRFKVVYKLENPDTYLLKLIK
ncbi:MAG: phospholipid carrier-dependent glycosyltransferase [Bacteroidota bacterium]